MNKANVARLKSEKDQVTQEKQIAEVSSHTHITLITTTHDLLIAE